METDRVIRGTSRLAGLRVHSQRLVAQGTDSQHRQFDHLPPIVELTDPNCLRVDPKNRLLARQNRFRVEAEIVRDLSLAAAGLLSDKIGGPERVSADARRRRQT